MISFWALAYIMLIHWIADFILQSDVMARNKSISNYWLTMHAMTYTFVMMCATAFPFTLIFNNPIRWIMWIMANGILHWITDYFTSRGSSFFFKKQDFHNGFIVVGIDQYIHLICLMGLMMALA